MLKQAVLTRQEDFEHSQQGTLESKESSVVGREKEHLRTGATANQWRIKQLLLSSMIGSWCET
jgi:hypothetical protein